MVCAVTIHQCANCMLNCVYIGGTMLLLLPNRPGLPLFCCPHCPSAIYAQDAVRIMAKSIVRNRAATTKLLNLKAQLQAVSLRITALKSTNTMAHAMRGATKVSPICVELSR